MKLRLAMEEYQHLQMHLNLRSDFTVALLGFPTQFLLGDHGSSYVAGSVVVLHILIMVCQQYKLEF